MYLEQSDRQASQHLWLLGWAILPLTEWVVKLDIPADVFITGDRLLDPDYNSKPTALCRRLSRGEVMLRTVKGATIADSTANSKAIA